MGRRRRGFFAECTKGGVGRETWGGGFRWLHGTQMRLDGRRSLDRQQQCWNQIEKFFPAPTPVTVVSEVRLDEYATKRLPEGPARAAVNNQSSALRRRVHLALAQKGRAPGPPLQLPSPHTTRER